MGSSGRIFKALFGALALLGFIWLFLVGILESSGGTNTNTTPTISKLRPARIFMHMEMIGREKKLAVHPESDLYTSKRRVPNGSDPIHNRRAGSSGHPPGHA